MRYSPLSASARVAESPTSLLAGDLWIYHQNLLSVGVSCFSASAGKFLTKSTSTQSREADPRTTMWDGLRSLSKSKPCEDRREACWRSHPIRILSSALPDPGRPIWFEYGPIPSGTVEDARCGWLRWIPAHLACADRVPTSWDVPASNTTSVQRCSSLHQ